MKKTKLFKKYIDILNGGDCKTKYLTEQQIASLKSRISWNPCSLTPNEVTELTNHTLYGNIERMIVPEHAEKGIDYLMRKCFKLNGQQRHTKQLENMPQEFFLAIQKYSHFTFVGFIEVNYVSSVDKSHYMPVWRIHTTDKQFFDYYMELDLTFNYTGKCSIKRHFKL